MSAKTPFVVTVVHCWSAPRSRSTALLYSFEARGANECVALDEPLYREWLIQRGDTVARPYTKEMIDGVPPGGITETTTEEEIFPWKRECKSLQERILEGAEQLATGGDSGAGVIFCKHMAKHCFLYNFEKESKSPNDKIKLVHKHLLLIRDPVQVLSSWDNSSEVHGNDASPDEVGIVPLLSIYSSLQSRPLDLRTPVVLLDSDELAADPEGTLSNVCKDLEIPYLESMITWKSGPHACDGPWAKVRTLCLNNIFVLRYSIYILEFIETMGAHRKLFGVTVVVPKCTQIYWLAHYYHLLR